MEHDLNWQMDWVPRQEAGSWKRRHECRYWLASYFPLKCSFNLRRYSQRDTRALACGFLAGAGCTGVFFKTFLREAVEGKGGYGAFEMRSGDAPGAVGAAPTGEVIPFDPDQAFIHTPYLFSVLWDSSWPRLAFLWSIARAV